MYLICVDEEGDKLYFNFIDSVKFITNIKSAIVSFLALRTKMGAPATHFDLLNFGTAINTLISFLAVDVQIILIAAFLVIDTVRTYSSTIVFNCSINDLLTLSDDAADLCFV